MKWKVNKLLNQYHLTIISTYSQTRIIALKCHYLTQYPFYKCQRDKTKLRSYSVCILLIIHYFHQPFWAFAICSFVDCIKLSHAIRKQEEIQDIHIKLWSGVPYLRFQGQGKIEYSVHNKVQKKNKDVSSEILEQDRAIFSRALYVV